MLADRSFMFVLLKLGLQYSQPGPEDPVPVDQPASTSTDAFGSFPPDWRLEQVDLGEISAREEILGLAYRGPEALPLLDTP